MIDVYEFLMQNRHKIQFSDTIINDTIVAILDSEGRYEFVVDKESSSREPFCAFADTYAREQTPKLLDDTHVLKEDYTTVLDEGGGICVVFRVVKAHNEVADAYAVSHGKWLELKQREIAKWSNAKWEGGGDAPKLANSDDNDSDGNPYDDSFEGTKVGHPYADKALVSYFDLEEIMSLLKAGHTPLHKLLVERAAEIFEDINDRGVNLYMLLEKLWQNPPPTVEDRTNAFDAMCAHIEKGRYKHLRNANTILKPRGEKENKILLPLDTITYYMLQRMLELCFTFCRRPHSGGDMEIEMHHIIQLVKALATGENMRITVAGDTVTIRGIELITITVTLTEIKLMWGQDTLVELDYTVVGVREPPADLHGTLMQADQLQVWDVLQTFFDKRFFTGACRNQFAVMQFMYKIAQRLIENGYPFTFIPTSAHSLHGVVKFRAGFIDKTLQ